MIGTDHNREGRLPCFCVWVDEALMLFKMGVGFGIAPAFHLLNTGTCDEFCMTAEDYLNS